MGQKKVAIGDQTDQEVWELKDDVIIDARNSIFLEGFKFG